MHTGFYKEKEENNYRGWYFLKQIPVTEDDGSCFYYETDDYDYISLNPYHYLKGLCDAFASDLRYRLGYPTFAFLDENGHLIHAFCKVEKEETDYYIDIRGVTTDLREFARPFVNKGTKHMYRLRSFKDLKKQIVPYNESAGCGVDSAFIDALMKLYGPQYAI